METIADHPVLGVVIIVAGSLVLGGLWSLLDRRLTESRMLLPHVRVRNLWLRRALRDYPWYDPPHKVEELLLTSEKAAENFDYFLRVRQQRAAHFRGWLRRHFRVTVALDESGVRALNRWGNRYAALLLDRGPGDNPTTSYFTYDPPWTGGNAGYNVLFDMGITLGEIIIASCPKLHWELEPTATILPRTAKMLKRTPGMSFQRPQLTGFDNPAAEVTPLHSVWGFAYQMMCNLITFKGISRYFAMPRELRRNIRDEMLNGFHAVLRDYPAGDPYKLREQLGTQDFLELVDSEAEDE